MRNPRSCIKYNIVARSIRKCWDIDKSIYVVREIAEKIHTVLTDEKLRDSLLKRFERTKRFSAEKKANMTLEVFKEILDQ